VLDDFLRDLKRRVRNDIIARPVVLEEVTNLKSAARPINYIGAGCLKPRFRRNVYNCSHAGARVVYGAGPTCFKLAH
jgi:hypothetical protein